LGGFGAVPYISMVRFTTWRHSPSLRFTKDCTLQPLEHAENENKKKTLSPHRGSNLGLLSQNRRK